MAVKSNTKPKPSARDRAKTLVHMTKEAKLLERRLGADACIVIAIFKDGDQQVFQDAGLFPMPPEHFYHVMSTAHAQGFMDETPKSKIIRPH